MKKRHLNKEQLREKDVSEGLNAIYGKERDDLQTMTPAGSKVTRILLRVIGALVLLSAFTFGGFFVYQLVFPHTSELPLAMSFQAPTEVKSGEEVTIVLDYSNPSRVPLASLALDINLPSTFILTSADPAPTNVDDLTWDIGTLASYTDGALTLTGVWLAAAPGTTTLQALAAYKPANFNADFHEVATTSIMTTGSVLVLALEGPEDGTPGQILSYTATLTNTGAQAFDGLAVGLALPQGFVVTSSTPMLPVGAASTWDVGRLEPAGVFTGNLVGSFTADASDVREFVATAKIITNNQTLLQTETHAFTDVKGSAVRLELVGNGGTGTIAADPGSILRLSVRVGNGSEAAISSVSALLDFQGESLPIDWANASYDGGRLTREGIVFDSAVIGSLEPGGRKIFNLSLPLKAEVAMTEAEAFTVTMRSTYNEVTVSSQPLSIVLNADTKLVAEARYYDGSGAPLGSGPLPPRVGDETVYRLGWQITNGLHALDKVKVVSTLPPGVTWKDFASADLGAIRYDDASRTITWEITGVPIDVQTVFGYFRVSITPTEDDVGKYVKVLSGTAFTATDLMTSASIERSAEALTTELSGDTYASGQGAVIE